MSRARRRRAVDVTETSNILVDVLEARPIPEQARVGVHVHTRIHMYTHSYTYKSKHDIVDNTCYTSSHQCLSYRLKLLWPSYAMRQVRVVMNDDSLEIFLKHVDDAFLALVTHAQPRLNVKQLRTCTHQQEANVGTHTKMQCSARTGALCMIT